MAFRGNISAITDGWEIFMFRYLIGIFLTIGLIILLIILLVGGNDDGGKGSNKAKVPLTSKELISYANTDSEVRLFVDGPINSVQEHQQAQITVSKENTKYEQRRGYNGQVEKMYNFANTETSYSEFLHALAYLGYTKGETKSELRDENGYCPKGSRYVFEIFNNGKSISRLWATSCGKKLATYQGSVDSTLALFYAQVPDYRKLNKDFDLH
jgi:hypothetical protein